MNKFSVMMHSGLSILRDQTFTLSYDPSSSTLSDCVAIDYPSYSDKITMWGTCNGLICLSPRSEHVVILWNPATKQVMEVPIKSPDDELFYVAHGIGTYNDEFDDFKVVRFEGVDEKYCCKVKVYTLKSNSWRRLENIPYQITLGDMEYQVAVNGAMHCLAYTSPQYQQVIVSFDFKDEKLDEMPLPNFRGGETNLCSLGGSLCLLCWIIQGRVDVWEMKTYGVAESWAKLFTINQDTIYGFFERLVPLQFVKNDQVLLGYDTDVNFHLDLYDLKRGTSINLKAHAYDQDNYAAKTFAAFTFVYVESLVKLNLGTYGGPPEIYSDADSDFEDSDDDAGEEEDLEDSDDDAGEEEEFEESDDDFGEEDDMY